MIDVGSAIGYLMLDTSGFEKGFESAFKDMESFIDKTKSTNDRLSAFGSASTKVGSSLTKYVTLPLVGAGTAFTTFAADAESALDSFSAKVGDAVDSTEKYEDVLSSIYENNYGESYEDIADAMGDVVIALGDMDPTNMQEVTESALALRDVYGYDVPESLRTVDTLMNNFGLTAEQAFDYIVKGQQSGLDFSGEFLDTINEYSVQFKKLGFSAEDMFAILKQGADSGAWNLDKIGDAIKEFSIRAIDGSNTTIEGFEAIGLSADDMAQKFASGGDTAKQAFYEVIGALSDMEDPVQQNIAGVNLFGTMWEDLGPEVIEQLANITSETVNTKGAMDELKEVKYDNLSGALGGLSRSLQVAGASLGKYLIPVVESLIGFVQDLTDKFNGLSEGSKQIIVVIGLIAAAIGPVLLIVGKIATGISTFMTVLPTITSTLSTIGTALSGFAAPIAAVIAAVVALKLAWDTNFGGIRDTVSEFVTTVTEKFTEIFTFIQTAVSAGMAVVSELWNSNWMGIRTIFEDVWNVIETVFGNVITILTNSIELFLNLITLDWDGAWENIKAIFSAQWENIKSLFQLALDFILNLFLNIIPSIKDAALNVIGAVKDAFMKRWNETQEWFDSVIEDPVGTILSISIKMYQAGASIFQSMLDGLKSVWQGITEWVSDCVDWIVDRVAFWQSESSKVSKSSTGADGSHAAGLDYVPFNGYRAILHQGERVLTQEENRAYTNGLQGAGNLTIEVPLYLNGRQIAKATAKDMNKELAKLK